MGRQTTQRTPVHYSTNLPAKNRKKKKKKIELISQILKVVFHCFI